LNCQDFLGIPEPPPWSAPCPLSLPPAAGLRGLPPLFPGITPRHP